MKTKKILGLITVEETYTLSEYKEILEAKNNTVEYIATKLKKNPKVWRMAVTFMANMLMLEKVAYADNALGTTVNKVNEGGFMIVTLIQTVGYWICIILCAIEILRCLLNGNNRQITESITKYIIAFGALYFLPWIFDFIKLLFG